MHSKKLKWPPSSKKETFLLWFIIFLFGNGTLLGEDLFAFVSNHQAKAVIVVPSELPAKIKSDINAFNDAVRKCSGTEFAIVQKKSTTQNNIVLKVVEAPPLERDRYTIAFPDCKTMLITGSDWSIRAAFNYILEESFGVRFLFYNGHTKKDYNLYPAHKNVAIARQEINGDSDFKILRRIGWRLGSEWEQNWNLTPPGYQSHFMMIDVFPVYKYAVDQSWPKAIMPILRGKRYMPPKAKAPLDENPYIAIRGYSSHWQPCFTNPKTTEIAIANILEIMKKNPSKEFISLDLNDNGGNCECPDCLKATTDTNGSQKRNSCNYVDYTIPYWTFVNKVAAAVSEKYPHLRFNCIAYREVTDPPPFQLHKNVLPIVCLELSAMIDPEVHKKRLEIFKHWSEKAQTVCMYDYLYGMNMYLLPRIYFKKHSSFLKELHRINVRSNTTEAYAVVPFAGPQYYLTAKMLNNLNTDVEKTVDNWCVAAVGEKAAPFLRKYYQFWENYWSGEEIRKTQWFQNSKNSTYMQLGEQSSHTYALKKGDMKNLRFLLESTIARCQTAEQKERAELFLELFELSESSAAMLFSELIQPDGTLKTGSDALELLSQLPTAIQAGEKLKSNPYLKYYAGNRGMESAQLSNIGKILPFIKDPKVAGRVRKLADDKNISPLLRGLFKIWLGSNAENLAPENMHSRTLKNNDSFQFFVNAIPGKTYVLMFDAFIEETDIEGRLNYIVSPCKEEIPVNHIYYLDNRLNGGQWMTFTGISEVPASANKMRIQLYTRSFEVGNKIMIRNLCLYCLDDLVQQ